MHFTIPLTIALMSSGVLGHPGHHTSQEIAERAAFLKTSKRDLSHCAAKMRARGVEQRAVQRRAALANEMRKKRDIAIGM